MEWDGTGASFVVWLAVMVTEVVVVGWVVGGLARRRCCGGCQGTTESAPAVVNCASRARAWQAKLEAEARRREHEETSAAYILKQRSAEKAREELAHSVRMAKEEKAGRDNPHHVLRHDLQAYDRARSF